MGRMWCVILKMYMRYLKVRTTTTFSVEQGVALGCSVSLILFSVFIGDLLREVEEADLGI